MTFQEGFTAQALVIGWTQEGRAFTAWEVTRHLRALGYAGVRHAEVRALVHNAFAESEMPGYDRALSVVDGSGARALVYYPKGLAG